MKHIKNCINQYKIISTAAITIICLFLLSSCLKDTRENLSVSPPLVGFLFPNPNFYPVQGGYLVSAPLSYSGSPQTVVYDSTMAYPSGSNSPLEIELSYTSFPKPFKGPVTVTVGVDSTEIAAINAADGTSFRMLPAGSYTLPNNGMVTIEPVVPGNYPVAVVYPQVTTSMLDTAQQYLLPLKIMSVQQSGIVIASNLNEAAMQIVVK
ncbi:MAG: DUF1735 domain-containing protein [Chitinophagaceae bacterium]|nr:MAG: DUF1735 domain-containing protein [Chitinophagaceae bacterium]